jgi:TRAP-type C4-dicarboxylate transport system permease small subunit
MKTPIERPQNPPNTAANKPLTGILNAADRVTRLLSTIGVGLAAMSLLSCLFTMTFAVAMRYIFVKPQAWTDEMVGYLLVGTVAGSVAHALRHNEHIAVDLLTERLGELGKRITEVAGLTAIIIVSGLLMAESYETMAFSKMIGVRSNGELATHMYLPQSVLVLGFALLFVTAIVGLARRLYGMSAFSEADEILATEDDTIQFTKKVGIE